MAGAQGRIADFWDELTAAWLAGEDPLPDPLPRWYASYDGRGDGQVTRDAFAEPYVGDLRGTPRMVILGLNPGQACLDFQGPNGIFAREIRERGLYSAWAAPFPYLGEARSVPMANRVARALELLHQASAYRAENQLVFCHPETGSPYDPSKMRERFYDAMRAAKLGHKVGRKGGITFYALRHTFGTQMAAKGAPLRAIQEWMGHADAKTTETTRRPPKSTVTSRRTRPTRHSSSRTPSAQTRRPRTRPKRRTTGRTPSPTTPGRRTTATQTGHYLGSVSRATSRKNRNASSISANADTLPSRAIFRLRSTTTARRCAAMTYALRTPATLETRSTASRSHRRVRRRSTSSA